MDQIPGSVGLLRVLSVYGVLVLVGLVGAIGDATVNQWARTSRTWWWVLSCVIWILAATLFGYVLRWRYFTFSIAVVLALLVHSAMVIFLDRMYYGVRLAAIQWVGIICAIAAFCLLEIGRQAVIPPSEARDPPQHSKALRG